MTLDNLPIGKPAIIIPHTEVTVRKVAPLGDPLELYLRGYTMTLRKEDAARIEVRPKEEI